MTNTSCQKTSVRYFLTNMSPLIVKHGLLNFIKSLNYNNSTVWGATDMVCKIIDDFWIPHFRLMTEDKEVKVTLHASTILLHDSLYPEALNFDNFARMLDKVVDAIVHDRVEVESEILETEFECTTNDQRNFLVDRLAHLSSVLPPGMCCNIISQFLDCSNQEALLHFARQETLSCAKRSQEEGLKKDVPNDPPKSSSDHWKDIQI